MENDRKVKICGLKRPEDIAIVNACRPDFVGFVFAKSSRRISEEQAAILKKSLDGGIKSVGVFANEEPERIARIAERGIIDMIQLHGDEDRAYMERLRELTDKPFIKAVRVQSQEQILEEEKLPCEFLLLDTYTKGQYGGSGKTFERSLIPKLEKPYFLAGGLDQWNVAEALGECTAFAADVSSSVERNGCKDEKKVKAFIQSVRAFKK